MHIEKTHGSYLYHLVENCPYLCPDHLLLPGMAVDAAETAPVVDRIVDSLAAVAQQLATEGEVVGEDSCKDLMPSCSPSYKLLANGDEGDRY